ncbi:MAG: pseudouridine synthase [Candidatus Thiodiazotropha sp. (ex Monitilora ramsayi)]|nr:pseudouridine synthase [Candidatus Thiodiazotropha sp. (ex Monitilora ramsayi)]
MEIQINHAALESREEIPYIHRPGYAHNLLYCLHLAASQPSNVALIAAKALLSSYDGERYPFNAVELAQLDSTTLEAVLTVFRLRALGTPTHKLILNGDAVYIQIAERWQL